MACMNIRINVKIYPAPNRTPYLSAIEVVIISIESPSINENKVVTESARVLKKVHLGKQDTPNKEKARKMAKNPTEN